MAFHTRSLICRIFPIASEGTFRAGAVQDILSAIGQNSSPATSISPVCTQKSAFSPTFLATNCHFLTPFSLKSPANSPVSNTLSHPFCRTVCPSSANDSMTRWLNESILPRPDDSMAQFSTDHNCLIQSLSSADKIDREECVTGGRGEQRTDRLLKLRRLGLVPFDPPTMLACRSPYPPIKPIRGSVSRGAGERRNRLPGRCRARGIRPGRCTETYSICSAWAHFA